MEVLSLLITYVIRAQSILLKGHKRFKLQTQHIQLIELDTSRGKFLDMHFSQNANGHFIQNRKGFASVAETPHHRHLTS
uniref:Putative secreted protein n=1 Tax=Panstrongylus lignarius TaxID=156445 RepID=A0A224XWR2_9HEMI